MNAAASAIEIFDLDPLDDLMVCLPLIMIVIALCIAFAVRIVFSWRGVSRIRADDPYFFPIGECPVIPDQISARALPRIESGGRETSPRSSAAVLTSSEGARHV